MMIALLGASAAAFGQAASNKPPKDASVYFGESDLQSIMKSVPTAPNGKPGAFSKRLWQDSTYSTAFIRLNAPDQPHAHGEWSEVFVVKEGSGVLETGGTITGVTGGSSAVHTDIFVNGPPPAPKTPAEIKAAEAAAARRAATGDKAGTGIEGGHKQKVGPGDVILIPAGVAHRWVQVDTPVVYLDTKFPLAK
jgi:mannose-6-phosphate isomerase-like protein (cupin superfamily)